MASRFVITDHALDRFVERYDGPDALHPDHCGPRLLAELERAVPFGRQVGDGELYLLPCGLVAAVVRQDGCRFVKTVLTREHAIANMESQGAILRPARKPIRTSIVEVEAELRVLAQEHFENGLGRKKRNAQLRARGFALDGRAAEVYRAAYRKAQEERWAAHRAAYLQRHAS